MKQKPSSSSKDKKANGRKNILLLLVILLLAFGLRFIYLSQADVLTDEGSLGFRAVGFLDFLSSPYQTTPLEWVNDRSWWFSLSFHDHPVGFFVLQNFAFKLLGESVAALRLPSAIFGLLAVLMLFLIGRRLGGDKLGLLAALMLAINDFHVWVARLGLQESAVIFFTLLAFWLWLKSYGKPKYLWLFGAVFGAALMIKLNAIIILPLIILHAWFSGQKSIFKSRHFYFSLVITLLVTAPYWLYNLLMQARFGHFDFQFSYLFGQDVPAWQIRPGRFEFPTKIIAIKYFFINLKNTLSPAFLIISIGSFLYLCFRLFRPLRTSPPLPVGSEVERMGGVGEGWRQADKTYRFLFATIILYFLFFLSIGPSTRFLTLIVPWLCLLIAIAVTAAYSKAANQKIATISTTAILCLFLAYELFFALTTNLMPTLSGKENLTHSHLTQLTKPYGYNQLEGALSFLSGKKPTVTLPIVNANLNNFVKASAARQTGQPTAYLIIYDPRLYGEAVLWFLTRRMYYQGWPVIDYDIWSEAEKNQGAGFFKSLGFTDFYYIASAGNLPLDPSVKIKSSNEALSAFEEELKIKKAEITAIHNSSGQPVFTIYHFK